MSDAKCNAYVCRLCYGPLSVRLSVCHTSICIDQAINARLHPTDDGFLLSKDFANSPILPDAGAKYS